MESKSFSESERKIAAAINGFPIVKKILKRAYQTVNYVLYRKKYKYKCQYALETIPSGGETFFGYYDKSPISGNNKYILFHESNYPTSNTPNKDKKISIGVFDIDTKNIIYTREVNSYNWQQGCRLQWLDSNKFIFNDFNDKIGYHSVVSTIKTNRMIEEEVISTPIYDCYYDNKFALSLNFERLNFLRPDYGYRNHQSTSNFKNINDDGIEIINLKTKEASLLLSLKEIINIECTSQILHADYHKINHIMISPNGDQFMFLHRYFINNRRFDRLMVYNFMTNSLQVLASDNMVSHCSWKDEDFIIGYLRDHVLGDKYYQIDIKNKEKTILGENVTDKFGDGHPSVWGELVLFDTYPDKARMKKLFIYNTNSKELFELGEFFEGLKYNGQTRCDLHPRFSEDGHIIFFDSVHSGKRQLYWFKRV